MQKGISPTDLNDPAHCLYGMKLSDFLHIEAIFLYNQESRLRMQTALLVFFKIIHRKWCPDPPRWWAFSPVGGNQ